MNNNYYTYAYLREDGTPYYVGKGKGQRINRNVGRTVKAPPKERRIYLKKNLTEEEAFRHEVYMIDVLGRKDLGTGILRNKTDGGEGTTMTKRSHSEETKEKIRQKALGRKYSQEHKDKLSEMRKGKKIHTEEHKQCLREKMLGNTINLGKKADPEVVKRRQESFRKTMELRKEQRT